MHVDTFHTEMLGQAGQGNAEQRVRGCAHPVRLKGATTLVDTTSGDSLPVYGSADELYGITYVRCGNRREAVCPSCSREYRQDAWHLLACGLQGGKGVPATVAGRPSTSVTLTAPIFGAVHGVRSKGLCRARRSRQVCPHGSPTWCHRRHEPEDPCVGEPLCERCYDYTAHVVWQFHANERWRRFLIALQRQLAVASSLSAKEFAARCKVSFSKVVEFQSRGAVHVHSPMRLDGPEGPDGPPSDLALTTADLERAVRSAARAVSMFSVPLLDGTVFRLRWGDQVDTKTICNSADRDGKLRSGAVHPERVAAYLAKYLTKATIDFGLEGSVRSTAHAATEGASAHALRLIEVAERLGRTTPGYERLIRHLGTLGYRGHPITKSRAYSVTFGQIRRARRRFRANAGSLPPDADVRQLLDEPVPEGFVLVSSWVFDGLGYLDLDGSAAAVSSACRARARRAAGRPHQSTTLGGEPA